VTVVWILIGLVMLACLTWLTALWIGARCGIVNLFGLTSGGDHSVRG
jgi:hypothetical protein